MNVYGFSNTKNILSIFCSGQNLKNKYFFLKHFLKDRALVSITKHSSMFILLKSYISLSFIIVHNFSLCLNIICFDIFCIIIVLFCNFLEIQKIKKNQVFATLLDKNDHIVRKVLFMQNSRCPSYSFRLQKIIV